MNLFHPSTRKGSALRRLVLTGSILPFAMVPVAKAADITWAGAVTVVPEIVYNEGLIEYRSLTGNGDINTTVFTEMGAVDRPRLGESNNKPADINENGPGVWSNNQVWRYTGQFFDADGIFTFAENIDDRVRVFIDGTLRLSDDGWNVQTRTNTGVGDGNSYGMGPNGDGWHTFEVRFQNGGGGAGTVTQDGWGGGDNGTYSNMGFGLNVNGTTSVSGGAYSIPIEPAGGGATLFRYLAFGNDAHVTSSSTVTLDGTGLTVSENSISFETGAAPVTLTVNSIDAQQRTLVSKNTYVGNAGPTPSSSSDVTFDVAAGQTFNPGTLSDGTATGVSITKTGAGTLLFDSVTQSNLDGSTLKLNAGLTSVVTNSGGSPLGNLPNIEINGTSAKLRVGGGGTLTQNLVVNESGTLEHTSAGLDTLSGAVSVTAGKNLTADISDGVLRINGNVTGVSGQVTKTGAGVLALNGTTSLNTIAANAGRIEAFGNVTLASSPALTGTGTLALFGTGNSLPSIVSVPSGSLEITSAALGGSSVALTGGTLALTAQPGLAGKFYNGGNNEARTSAFGAPASPANTYGNYTSYFNDRDTATGTFGGLGVPAVSTATTTGGAYSFSFNADGDADAPYSVFGFGSNDNIVIRMSGLVRIPQSGSYTFGTTSDDGSMLYVNGQTVVGNNADQGMTRRTGTVFLEAGMHQIDIGMFEGGGGAGLIVDWAGPGINGTQVMTNSAFRQTGVQTFNNAIDIQQSSTVDVVAQEAIANSLTIQPGRTLTKTGGQLTGPVTLNGAGTYGFNVSGTQLVTNVINGGAATSINKTGTGILILDNTTSPQFTGGGTITVSQGTLGVLLQTGGSSPTGAAGIAFAGGGLVLSSKGGDQSYPIPTFTGDGLVEARQIGSGVAGPLNINLTGSLGISGGQTVSLGTANGYVMNIGGAATGTGTAKITGGTVNGTSAGAFNGLNLLMAPPTGGSATTTLSSNTVNLESLATSGRGTSSLSVGSGSGTATLTLNTLDNSRFGGTLNAVSGSSLNVVMSGFGTQIFDNPAASNVNSMGVQNPAAILELVGGVAGSGAINLGGGTLQVASTGLMGEYYDAALANNAVYANLATFNANFAGLTPAVRALTTTGGQSNMDFNNNNGSDLLAPFASQGFNALDNIQARWNGRIYIAEAGSYTFSSTSDDGSMVFINGATVVDNNFFQGMTTRSGTVNLGVGYHDLTLGFYEGGGGAGAIFSWQTPGSATSSPIPNSVLSTTSLFTGSNAVNLTASSVIDSRGGINTFGALTQSPGTTLTTTAGTVTFPQVNLSAGAVGYDVAGRLNINSINSGAAVTAITKSGPGTLVLSATGPQLTAAGSSIVVNEGTLAAVGGTNNPLGVASVTLAEGSTLGLSSTTTGTTVFAPALSIPGTAGINAGRYGAGVAGPVVAALANNVTIAAGKTLNASSTVGDNYTLALAGNVSGPGTLAVTSGVVSISTASPGGGTTIAPGAVLVANGSTYSGGTITPNGGAIYAAGGINNFGATAIAGLPISGGTTGGLSGALHVGFVNPAGGFGSEAGLAATLALTPTYTATLKGDLLFGPHFGGDAPFASFFGTSTASTDIFTAVFSGSYTALANGSHAFRRSINDDGMSMWVDLNQNGVFELAGSSGNERITHVDGCCGPSDDPAVSDGGSANLSVGQTYKVAFVLQDTGGGSSMAARVSSPLSPEAFVNPSTGAGGIWSTGVQTGGVNVTVDSGAELRAGSIANGRSLLFNGASPKLILESPTATSSSVQALYNSTATNATVQLGANNLLTVDAFNLGAGTTLTKSGAGTLTTGAQNMGAGSTLQVTAGTVNFTGSNAASSGSVVLSGTSALNVPGVIGGSVTLSDSSTLNVPVGGGVGSVTAGGASTATLSGSITGDISVSGTAQVSHNGTATGFGIVSGGTLKGNGALGGLIVNAGGTVAPGNSIGTLTTTSLLMHDLGVFSAEIQGGLQSDRIIVNGGVTLLDTGDTTGATLSLSLLPSSAGFFATPGDVFPLIINDGIDPVVGTFAQGTSITVDGHVFNIAYDANLDAGIAGNDVALTYVVPEPGALTMLLGGFAMLFGIRRARRRA